jgi:hypothetical protein
MDKNNNCDNCKYYKRYYDSSDRWKCEVDDTAVHPCLIGTAEEDDS